MASATFSISIQTHHSLQYSQHFPELQWILSIFAREKFSQHYMTSTQV